ncbi:hypothetical protein SAMN05444156_2858 [Verrucomicrobium sp. GAS474]|uniref:hypothetical protein n=1 Tax=Verrucomicrobium sp. GAS474 TaxID=1882831 RepID=UPI00087DA51D|nr:hypothetical protein [Verrucomicrobium sp. GAS474]SDU25026.1 hypothetical protein SAMN05444156_2858 [Verrucomicrobium sp. GAS474]
MPITLSPGASAPASAGAASASSSSTVSDPLAPTSGQGGSFASWFDEAAIDPARASAATALAPLADPSATASSSATSDDASASADAGTTDAADALASSLTVSDATLSAVMQAIAAFTQAPIPAAPQPLPQPGADSTTPAEGTAAAATATAAGTATLPSTAADALASLPSIPGQGTLPDGATPAAASAPAPAATATTASLSAAGVTPDAASALTAAAGTKTASVDPKSGKAQAATASNAKTAGKDQGKGSADAAASSARAFGTSVSSNIANGTNTASASSAAPSPAEVAAALTAPAVTAAGSVVENNAAATVVGGTNSPSLADLGVLAASVDPRKTGEITDSSAKSKGKEASKDLSADSSADGTEVGTVFSGVPAMGLFTENSARLGTTTEISFGNALKAYRTGSGGTISSSASTPGSGERDESSLSEAQLRARVRGTVAQDGATGAVSSQTQSHAATAPQSGSDGVDAASANRFLDLVKQAAAQPALATPQRISVDLQTPPGETVTVIFSQNNNSGQVRAQLSASDPTSLQWLQQQVDSLRGSTNGNGANVVWLPPQLDNQQNRDARQDNPQQNQQNPNGQNRPSTRSAEDLALADSLFGSNGALSSLTSR